MVKTQNHALCYVQPTDLTSSLTVDTQHARSRPWQLANKLVNYSFPSSIYIHANFPIKYISLRECLDPK